MRDELACPACGGAMRITQSQELEVDVCRDCGSLWLDQGEFDPLVANRFSGGDVESLFEIATFPSVDPRACPVDGTEMGAVFCLEIELDRCEFCGGVFLDASDRAVLRAQTTRERDLAATKPPKQPSFSETESLELDLDAINSSPGPQIVVCGGCGASVNHLNCMKRMDAYWCEACVIAGNYPGGYGPPIASQVAAAASAMASETTRLDRAKQKQRIHSLQKNASRDWRGARRMHPEEYGEFVESVKGAANRVIGLFKPKD